MAEAKKATAAKSSYKNVHHAMCKTQLALGGVVIRDGKNEYEGFSYTTLSTYARTVIAVAGEHDLDVTTTHKNDGNVVTVVTTVSHYDSDTSVTCETALPVVGNKHGINPKHVGAVLTYGRKYNLASLFCLGQEEDVDAEPGGLNDKPSAPASFAPTEKQLGFAQKLANEKGYQLPVEATRDGKACSAFIDSMLNAKPKAPKNTQQAAPAPQANANACPDSILKRINDAPVEALEQAESWVRTQLEGEALEAALAAIKARQAA